MTSPAFRDRGEIEFDDARMRVGPSFAPEHLERSALRQLGTLHVGPGWSRFTCRTRVEGREAHATLVFEHDRLARIELMLLASPEGAEYSMADEAARRTDHEAWMQDRLGVGLVPKPIVVDGVPVQPDRSVANRPMHAAFGWGEVVSAMDPKNGAAGVTVSYHWV